MRCRARERSSLGLPQNPVNRLVASCWLSVLLAWADSRDHVQALNRADHLGCSGKPEMTHTNLLGRARRSVPAQVDSQDRDYRSGTEWCAERRLGHDFPGSPWPDALARLLVQLLCTVTLQRSRHVLHFPLADSGTTSSLSRVRASVCSLIPPTWADFLAVTPSSVMCSSVSIPFSTT